MISVTPERLELLRLALLSARHTDRLLDEWLRREAGLAIHDLTTLQAIDTGFVRPSDVAHHLAEPLPAVAQAISRLVGRGLVGRRHGTDPPCLHLTPAGEHLLAHACLLIGMGLHDGRHRLSTGDAQRAKQALERYFRLLGVVGD